MDHRSLDREEGAARDVRDVRPEPPAPVLPGSLAWASAVGNQAVQALARQEAGPVEEEAVPDEVAAMEAAGIGPAEVAGLEALEDLPEDELAE